jgi:hypothetical protein
MPCCRYATHVERLTCPTGTPRHDRYATRSAGNRNVQHPRRRALDGNGCQSRSTPPENETDAYVHTNTDTDAVVHVVIMPGFLIPSTAPTYGRLSDAIHTFLSKHQKGAHTVDVVAMGLFDWLKIALLGNDFRDYLDKAARLIESIDRDDAVVIVGHSAGGWVARLLLGADTVTYNGWSRPGLRQRVKRLVTLGTPHYSKEAYPFGRVKERVYSGERRVFDSSLAFTNEFFGQAGDLAPTEIVSFLGVVDDAPTLVSLVSYAANAGAYVPGMKGDGVVPIDVAGTCLFE